ncbi:hypothetical protein K443DRAFT_676372 [Laccaria amethystina LaAM-08-1]|uniref:Uncharacterized protein n=1 Tax=Laccaria amethystina LaAM-08-1 TaxID=1095629 RepID=A0A0C9XG19_9AGAR|nr:hypothetical protein K443DRAFT_676372 [Laccaria amethystina LaAM-08-1]
MAKFESLVAEKLEVERSAFFFQVVERQPSCSNFIAIQSGFEVAHAKIQQRRSRQLCHMHKAPIPWTLPEI